MTEQNKTCLICNNNASFLYLDNDAGIKVDCIRCGLYYLEHGADTYIEQNKTELFGVKLSYWIKSGNLNNHKIILSIGLLKKLNDSIELPKPKEQANLLLTWLGKNIDQSRVITSFNYLQVLSVIGAHRFEGFDLIYKYLEEEKFIKKLNISNGIYSCSLTMKGWEEFEKLQKPQTEGRYAFMAMQFDNEILQKIYTEFIVRAVKETGFTIRKVNEFQPAGLIDNHISVAIRKSHFIISDLSDDNRGAYWESGFASGLGKPVIYICEEDKFEKGKTHFDTNHHLTLTWKNTPEAIEKFINDLKVTIRATLPSLAIMEDKAS